MFLQSGRIHCCTAKLLDVESAQIEWDYVPAIFLLFIDYVLTISTQIRHSYDQGDAWYHNFSDFTLHVIVAAFATEEIAQWLTYLFTCFWHIALYKLSDPYNLHWKLWQLLLETDNLLDNQTLIPNSLQNRMSYQCLQLHFYVWRAKKQRNSHFRGCLCGACGLVKGGVGTTGMWAKNASYLPISCTCSIPYHLSFSGFWILLCDLVLHSAFSVKGLCSLSLISIHHLITEHIGGCYAIIRFLNVFYFSKLGLWLSHNVLLNNILKIITD